jgi:hypothetical protein
MENENVETDLMYYLMTSNIEESRQKFVNDLNREIETVRSVVDQDLTDVTIKKHTMEWIDTTSREDDIVAKQYLILFVLHMSIRYRRRFIPDDPKKGTIHVNPSKFIYFVKHVLPVNFKKLINGEIHVYIHVCQTMTSHRCIHRIV